MVLLNCLQSRPLWHDEFGASDCGGVPTLLTEGAAMTISIVSMTFLAGLVLIVLAVIGGGIEFKEVKIGNLTFVHRILSFIVGCCLIALCFFTSQKLQELDSKGSNISTTKSEIALGASIRNHLITVADVKKTLRHLGQYSGPIDDDPTTYYFQAVGDFQRSHNIAADGLVGPETYAKLTEAWPEYFSPADLKPPPHPASTPQPLPTGPAITHEKS
jgi:hypothetical protein